MISVGHNSYQKSHPLQAKFAKRAGRPSAIYLHAEISALIKCRGVPHRIHIERVDMKGNTKMAKPCEICELALKEAGVKIISYTI